MTDMPRSLWKQLFRYVLVIAIIAIPAAALLSNEGFCFPRARFVSDAEMIESAVRGIAESNRMAINASDAAVNDFLRRNPKCCAVDRRPRGRTFLDVLTGWNVAKVEVNYERAPTRPSWQTERYYKHYVSVSACGEFLKTDHGTGTPTLETAK